MSAGRPEIAAAFSAAWRHGHAGRAELRAWQDARLRRLVLHAYEQVPFYRRLFDRHRLHPRHIRGVVDLELIPFTDKAELLRQSPGALLARDSDQASLLSTPTSGFTAAPFNVRHTWLEDQLQFLLRLRAFHSLGVGPRDRVVVVGPVDRSLSQEPELVGRTLRALGFRPRLVLDGWQEPAKLLARLAEASPDVLVSLPGVLDRLTAPEYADALRQVRPRLIVVTGEVSMPAVRARLHRAFGAPVYETYGSQECPLIAWECRHSGDLHVCDDGVIVEVLKGGRPAAPGEAGEVVVTNLYAYAMPFLRYRIGDLATRAGPCRCGAPFSTLGAIQGRTVEYFSLPGGRLLHPYEIASRLIWRSQDWIRQFQLVQERSDRVVLCLAAAKRPDPDHLAEVDRVVRPALGPGVEFAMQLVSSIPFETTGKIRSARGLSLPG